MAEVPYREPLFTKRHYEWLAELYIAILPQHGAKTLSIIIERLKLDNPNFDEHKFLTYINKHARG